MIEQWKDIENYEGLYQISNCGRVCRVKGYRCKKQRILKHGCNNRGYKYVNLWKNNQYKTYTIHTLVLKTFIGYKPEGKQCRHLDGNKHNNKIINLRWGTNSENQLDRATHGTTNRGEQSYNAKLTNVEIHYIRYLIVSGITQSQIAKQFHVNPHTISDIKTGKTWRHI